ncbi:MULTISPECIES: PssE/Cps14G family polysaccharide biosynthesis glycosyltransferase [unclassified Breznakia]|uniref:PssE/Cps14G family polysaccharide biosynthesis glycosyltransferase n=1 Tax=unclassified Breznakia TaxID=2623764 RepID=UPI002474DA21|nr:MULTISPECIES: PssE/Cps14G family polysaccharide biosynthesis glycosyltransferase [unclassified Breznakia]MDH6367910.1 UDP-N-acetylglucosamine transferase subunit ALG13 [Breznakia sp. PH1-1]MDH6404998.1 UDP-N-acetylglucosamine transferase subunit ALG13 [Breznakia sp. PF1-11]MDH6412691.1 UDP-N-acetylglucosamine transferase subunit ALG13 [Breznakia sp. PFB1-11]MDH6415073.1 UDP-N-acetylglucosamine transferase subunit ALG13 [Breznakia sp. PFB1-14]MDH6417384.1 UDP-N-acetylglucosamine transferase 
MIFVTLGTQDKSFSRLLEKIDELVEQGLIQEEIVVQSGCTKYTSKNMDVLGFIPMDQFNSYIENCTYMITHGGVGTIMNGINHDKKVIAVARRVEYGEHENNHQVEIVKEFSEQEYILGCKQVDELENAILQLPRFRVKPYISNNENFCKMLEELIES